VPCSMKPFLTILAHKCPVPYTLYCSFGVESHADLGGFLFFWLLFLLVFLSSLSRSGNAESAVRPQMEPCNVLFAVREYHLRAICALSVVLPNLS
jgi:hypothetical protein